VAGSPSAEKKADEPSGEKKDDAGPRAEARPDEDGSH
jgi:hypothetical protein